jgi:hypothetical protein
MSKNKKTTEQKQAEKILQKMPIEIALAPLTEIKDIFSDFEMPVAKDIILVNQGSVDITDPLRLRKIHEEINAEYYENLKKDITIYPCYTNRASGIGHPCLLKLYFDRTQWDKAQKIQPKLKDIFDLGKEFEPIIKNALVKRGYKIREEQRPFKDDTYELTGSWDLYGNHEKYDNISKINRELWVPLDMKSMDANIFNRIHDVRDLINHRSWHIRAYIIQILVYIYFDSLKNQDFTTPFGILALMNKSNKEVKSIEVYQDLNELEKIFKKCETINIAVKTKTSPFAEYNECCEHCVYEHICNIPKASKDAKFIFDGEINDKLLRREEIKPIFEEFKELDEESKNYFKEYNEKNKLTDFFTQDFEIILREQTRQNNKIFRTIIKCLNKTQELKNE